MGRKAYYHCGPQAEKVIKSTQYYLWNFFFIGTKTNTAIFTRNVITNVFILYCQDFHLKVIDTSLSPLSHTTPNENLVLSRIQTASCCRKKPNTVGWGYTFLKTLLEFLYFLLYPWKFQTKQGFTPRSSTKLCTPLGNFKA